MKRRMKLDYNNFMRFVDEVLDADHIETVQNNASAIAVGLDRLTSYLQELANYAIETENEFLIEWCLGLMIVKETEGGH